MKIGVLSDTHGFLDPKIPALFKGVDHILHAGDIGYASIILELEYIAPVTAVLGNNDHGMEFKETEWVELDGLKFMVHHIVPPTEPAEDLTVQLRRTETNVLVFGHTHRTFCQRFDDVLFFNPGYSGKPRLGLERSVALLEVTDRRVTHQFMKL